MEEMNTDTLRVLQKLDKIDASIRTVDDRVHDLDKRIELNAATVDTKLAGLPSVYVAKEEYREDKHNIIVTRRWTVGTAVAVIGLVLNNFVSFV